jgi:plastocyanin
VTIKKGTSVTWKNQDDAEHQLVLTSPNPPAELEGFGLTEGIGKGEAYSFTFEATGTFTYNDPTSPELVQGTIIVEE